MLREPYDLFGMRETILHPEGEENWEREREENAKVAAMDGKSLPSISFRDKTRRMSIREGVRLATHSSLPLSFESAVRKPNFSR